MPIQFNPVKENWIRPNPMWSNFTTMLGWGHYDIYEPNYRLGNAITSKLVFKTWYDFNLCRFLVISGVCTRAGWNNIKAGLGRGGQNKLCVWTTWCVGFWLIMQYSLLFLGVLGFTVYTVHIRSDTVHLHQQQYRNFGSFCSWARKGWSTLSKSPIYNIYIIFILRKKKKGWRKCLSSIGVSFWKTLKEFDWSFFLLYWFIYTLSILLWHVWLLQFLL